MLHYSKSEVVLVKKNNSSVKKFILFIVYQIFFIVLTAPIVIMLGPYDNMRKTIVSTLMATRHQYLITNLFSTDTLDKMLGESQSTFSQSVEDINRIKVKYKDSNEITRYDIHTDKFDGYLLEIKDPTKAKVVMTNELGKVGQKTSDMAREKDAIAAINGGAFVDRSPDGRLYAGTGAVPGGFVISQGKVIYPKSNIKVNVKENVIAFTKYGTLVVGDHSISELRKLNVQEAICFRPPTLIINGERQIHNKLEGGLNPRTAVGQKEDGTLLFLVVDGRKSLTKIGASLYDIQEILLRNGAVNAGNLDGGYSSTMYYNGEVINSPNAWDGERKVATAFYVEK